MENNVPQDPDYDDEPVSYVCGFVFDTTLRRLLLIKKLKPFWQAGLWNGIGGKIEPSDPTPLAAMQREFQEEAGTFVERWMLFQVEHFEDAVTVYFYIAVDDAAFKYVADHPFVEPEVKNSVEEVRIHNLFEVPYMQCIHNLQYLIPMGITKLVRIPPSHLPIL